MDNPVFPVNVAAVLLAAFVGILVLRDAKYAPGVRRPIRLFQAVVCYYFVLVYGISTLSVLGVTIQEGLLYYLKSGLLTRWGVILLLLVIAVEVLSYFMGSKSHDRPDI